MFLLGYVADKYHRLCALLGLEVFANRAEPGYAPCTSDLDYFWLHYPYQQLRDCFERPICSVPGATFDILDRYSDDGYNSFK
jgi:serine palmitoyltransferase